MFDLSRNVAVITARGGSKRIPRKNIRDFLGKPIIAYSITAAVDSGCFDEIMVSTDDKEIAEIALRYGAKVPFLRSIASSSDVASTEDVLLEVLTEYGKMDQKFEMACCIYPTAPFVTAEKLKLGLEILKATGVDSVIPVVSFSYPIQRALAIEENHVKMIWPEHENSRSQDLVPAYHDSGQFYWLRTACFLETQKLFSNNTVPIVISELEVQDIDIETDWQLAEMKFQLLLQKIT